MVGSGGRVVGWGCAVLSFEDVYSPSSEVDDTNCVQHKLVGTYTKSISTSLT